jgi:hypothetical protein
MQTGGSRVRTNSTTIATRAGYAAIAYLPADGYLFARTATWRSGYATVCKTVYSGSIPDVASTKSMT